MPTATTTPDAVTALKDQHRATWADGDYAAVAEHIIDAPAEAIVNGVALRGRDTLDVATGTGNLALAAARAGARVSALDLVPDLLERAKERARAEDLDIAWTVGDAEALPYEDAQFDVVTSVFGVQFVPRAAVVASELRRVCRPDGRIALVNWTADGLIGRLFSVMGRYMPTPPAFVTPPPRWGDEAFLRELFAGDDVQITRGTNAFRFPDLETYMTFFEENYGPTKRAKERLTGEGTWDDLRGELADLYRELNQATDGTLHIDSDFFRVVVAPS
ncbi:methyltransferase domain-containing protein [Svornostia abyssi]|uniref:Methyltransferase domain-containing protein n=1 Tax=Svornostia abyssi TaxID=2898438 RepID=A0ABY5PJT1_9ACTN|nr:methyltransferase domain-containing protein [Parviterribacteraceae bacterium J379]